ncbi:hypothetical protein JL721_7956 [Aureococcus anophagefferens]|nr:hypothetical protein JL721_7956 [Aureococcus anophagefferens]
MRLLWLPLACAHALHEPLSDYLDHRWVAAQVGDDAVLIKVGPADTEPRLAAEIVCRDASPEDADVFADCAAHLQALIDADVGASPSFNAAFFGRVHEDAPQVHVGVGGGERGPRVLLEPPAAVSRSDALVLRWRLDEPFEVGADGVVCVVVMAERAARGGEDGRVAAGRLLDGDLDLVFRYDPRVAARAARTLGVAVGDLDGCVHLGSHEENDVGVLLGCALVDAVRVFTTRAAGGDGANDAAPVVLTAHAQVGQSGAAAAPTAFAVPLGWDEAPEATSGFPDLDALRRVVAPFETRRSQNATVIVDDVNADCETVHRPGLCDGPLLAWRAAAADGLLGDGVCDDEGSGVATYAARTSMLAAIAERRAVLDELGFE